MVDNGVYYSRDTLANVRHAIEIIVSDLRMSGIHTVNTQELLERYTDGSQNAYYKTVFLRILEEECETVSLKMVADMGGKTFMYEILPLH